MSENSPTSTSAIGDPVAQQGIFTGYNVHITLGGVVVARSSELTMQIDNNVEEYYEIGSRTPILVEGPQSFNGTLNGFAFDTSKFRLAMGIDRDTITDSDLILGDDTFGDRTVEYSTPTFGTQPWKRNQRFTITCEHHIDGSNDYLEYKYSGCVINVYRQNVQMPGEVRETVTFKASRAHVVTKSTA